MRVVFSIAAATTALLLGGAALADPYDDCILAHMSGTAARDAVLAIERACIGKASATLAPAPADAAGLRTLSAVYAGSAAPALRLTINNGTRFAVTELVLSITDKGSGKRSDYTVREFVEPGGAATALTPLPDVGLADIFQRGQTRSFIVPIAERARDGRDFAKRYSWSIVATRGIPPS